MATNLLPRYCTFQVKVVREYRERAAVTRAKFGYRWERVIPDVASGGEQRGAPGEELGW
jgi:hypothetical protein